MNYILRRRGLGATSCREIVANMRQPVTVVRSDNIPERFEDNAFVFRWGCTSKLPPAPGRRLVNEARAIHVCNDKRTSRLAMQAAGVNVPYTHTTEDFRQHRGAFNGLWVSRPAHHAQGRRLSYGGPMEVQLYEGGYVSRLIDKVAEYRVYVIQGRVACVAQKTPGNPEDVAWNVARGGRFDNVRFGSWPLRACEQAILAAEVVGTDFCGVDVMVDEYGQPFVLEVNSAPSLTSPYRQQCFAKCFDWIVENGPVADVIVNNNWRDVIHPAIIEGR